MRKKHAFTLAETMISLAILGLIVLLFVIGLKLSNHNEKINTVSYDKVYNDVATAAKSVLTIDGKGHFTVSDDLRDEFAKRLDVERTWNNDKDNEWVNCDIVNATKENACNTLKGVTLTNGTNIGFVSGSNVNVDGAGSGLVGAALVDVNGKSSPNTAGSDQYVIPIYSDGAGETNNNSNISAATPSTSSTCTPCANQSTDKKVCSGDCNTGCTCVCRESDKYIGTGCVEYKKCLDGVPVIPANAVLNTKMSTCFECIGNKTCTNSNQKYDLLTCSCVTVCSNDKQKVVNGMCVCDPDKLNCLHGYNDSCECNYCEDDGKNIYITKDDGTFGCKNCGNDGLIANDTRKACQCPTNTQCPESGGSYNNSEAVSSLNECICKCDSTGYIQNNQTGENAKCICDAEGFCLDNGSCSECPIGEYCPEDGNENSIKCGTGRTTADTGTSSSSKCICDTSSNYYYAGGDTTNGESCVHCAPSDGKTYDSNGHKCQCTAGYYGNGENCTQCAAGTYSVDTNAEKCTPCASGTASNESGKTTACGGCLAGTYSDVEGLTVCKNCPDGSSTKGLSSQTACVCDNVEYVYDNDTNPKKCVSCYSRYGAEQPASITKEDGKRDCVPCYLANLSEPDANRNRTPLTPVWNDTTKRCEACPSGQHWDNIKDLCVLDGTVNGNCGADYIPITTPEQLALIGNDPSYLLSDNYCLMNDISLKYSATQEEGQPVGAMTSDYERGEGWEPIGNLPYEKILAIRKYMEGCINNGVFVPNTATCPFSNPKELEPYFEEQQEELDNTPKFTGVFDGNNKTISNLTINRPQENNVGLFSYNNGTIKKLNIKNVNVTGSWKVGGLVAENNSEIYQVSVQNGSVISTNDYISKPSIRYPNGGERLHNGYYDSTGGLVGCNKGTITKSFATVSVASNQILKFTFCSMIGVGGFAGCNVGTISDSYSTGSTESLTDGCTFAGGFVGGNWDGTINSVYSTGTVNGENAGGFVGGNWDGTISNSYYLKDDTLNINKSLNACSDGTCTGATAKTAAEMQSANIYKDAGWSSDIWCLSCNDYPKLKNMPAGAPACNNEVNANACCSIDGNNYVWDNNKNKCLQQCADNATRQTEDNSCKCNTGFVGNGYTCNPCTDNKYYKTNEEGTGICQDCPDDATANSEHDSCTCTNTNKEFENGSCVCKLTASSATAGKYFDSKACAINDCSGQKEYSLAGATSCSTCPGELNATTDHTSCDCNHEKKEFNISEQKCVCKYTPTEAERTAKAAEHKVWKPEICDWGSEFDSCPVDIYKNLEFPEGVTRPVVDATGTYPDCNCPAPRSRYDDQTNTCECPEGTYWNGTIGTCVLDAPLNNGNCGADYIPIYTAEQLAKIATNTAPYTLSGNYCLMNTIDLEDYLKNNNWEPIGSDTTPFSGIFDGNNNEINNLTINDLTRDTLAFFYKNEGTIKKVSLNNVNVNAKNYAAGFIITNDGIISNVAVQGNISAGSDEENDGSNESPLLSAGFAITNNNTIRRSSVNATVSTKNKPYIIAAGFVIDNNFEIVSSSVSGSIYSDAITSLNSGFVSDNYDSGIIKNCSVNATVVGSDATGFVYNNSGSIEKSSVTGNISSADGYAAGFVMCNESGILMSFVTADNNDSYVVETPEGSGFAFSNVGNISGSYVNGRIHGTSGFVNDNLGLIQNSYFLGDVECSYETNDVGGFAGINEEDGSITNVYFVGNVTSESLPSSNIGGFIATNSGNITNSYYNIDNLEIPACAGESNESQCNVSYESKEVLKSSPDANKNIFVYWDKARNDDGSIKTDDLGKTVSSNAWYFNCGVDYPRLRNMPAATDENPVIPNTTKDTLCAACQYTESNATPGKYFDKPNCEIKNCSGAKEYSLAGATSCSTCPGELNATENHSSCDCVNINMDFKDGECICNRPSDTVIKNNAAQKKFWDDDICDWKRECIEISTAEDLAKIGKADYPDYSLDGCYDLMKDIDLGSYTSDGGWVPIGSDSFTGIFNGNNHKITNLKIDRPNEDNQGLFASTDGANITNLTLENVNIIGNYNAGGLTAIDFGSTISNCSVSGTVIAKTQVAGGLIGYSSGYNYSTNVETSIKNCSSSANVTGPREVGGLIGSSQSGTIENCFATGTVTGSNFAGGLVGSANEGLITNSYSTGTVIGTNSMTGGLVGGASSNISNSYSTAYVSGNNSAGGLAGYISDNATIINSYSIGNVKGYEGVGGLVGSIRSGTIQNSYVLGNVDGKFLTGGILGNTLEESDITSSYYLQDNNTNQNISGCGDISCSGATPKTSSQLKLTPSANVFVDWDKARVKDENNNYNIKYDDNGTAVSSNAWYFNCGVDYPRLRNMPGGNDSVNPLITTDTRNNMCSCNLTLDDVKDNDYFEEVSCKLKTCPSDSTVNDTHTSCTCSDIKKVFVDTEAQCICKNSQTEIRNCNNNSKKTWDAHNCSCSCKNLPDESERQRKEDDGYSWNDDICNWELKATACPKDVFKNLVFPAGMPKPRVDAQGTQPSCSCPEPLSAYNIATNTCDCPEGTYWSNTAGTCVLNAQLDNGNCDANYIPIYNSEQFAKINTEEPPYLLSASYCLMNDISLDNYIDDKGWTPIGASIRTYFTGIFDGNNHKITGNVYFNNDSSFEFGLFGATKDATIKNLGFEGRMEDSSLISYHLNDYYDVSFGTLVGYAEDTNIEKCYVKGDISFSNSHMVGGLVGKTYGSSDNEGHIKNSFFEGSINGNNLSDEVNSFYLGGLVGHNPGGSLYIDNSYVHAVELTGVGSGSEYLIGGLIGGTLNEGVNIHNSYVQGNIGSDTYNGWSGGLIGDSSVDSLMNSYFVGEVHGDTWAGGTSAAALFADIDNWDLEIDQVYYNKEYAQNSIGSLSRSTEFDHLGKTTEEMKNNETYVGWDNIETESADKVWFLYCEQDYPRLRNMPVASNINPVISNERSNIGCSCNLTESDAEPGKYFDESNCAIKDCPDKQYSAGNVTTCTDCPDDATANDDHTSCECNNTNKEFKNGSCVCKYTPTEVERNARAAVYQIWDDKDTCDWEPKWKTCPENAVSTSVFPTCQCPEETPYWEAEYENTCLTCWEAFHDNEDRAYWNGTQCTKCPEHSKWNSAKHVCVVQDGGYETCDEGMIAIFRAEELARINDLNDPYLPNENYCLMNNINLQNYLSKNTWPVVIIDEGVFNGNNHTIDNFNFDNNANKNTGLFRECNNGGTIKNLGLTNVNVKGGDYTGALIGIAEECAIDNCYVKGGSVTGKEVVGGLVGMSATCSNYTSCRDDESQYKLTHSYADLTSVTGEAYVGGLIGIIAGSLEESYSNVSRVTANSDNGRAGGLAGYASDIINSYSITETLSSPNTVAGLTGRARKMTNSYAVVSERISGDETTVFGLAATSPGNAVDNSYCTVANYANMYSTTAKDANCTTIDEIKNSNIYLNAGWDNAIWCFSCGDYPRLKTTPPNLSVDKTSCKTTACIDCSTYNCNDGKKEAINVGGECICLCKEEILTNLSCPSGKKPDTTNTTCGCVIDCGENEHAENNVCVCNTGFVRQSGVCKTCPSNKPIAKDGVCKSCEDLYGKSKPKYNNGTCEACPSGTIWLNNGCKNLSGIVGSDGKLTTTVGTCEKGFIAITTAEQLKEIGTTTLHPGYGENFCLLNDINVSNLQPILFSSGIFDGNGYTIEYTPKENYTYCALFDEIRDATVRNLKIISSIKNNYCNVAAGLAKNVYSGIIANCSAYVDIDIRDSGDGINTAAGLVYEIDDKTNILYCDVKGKVTAGTDGGGFIYDNFGGTITNSYADVDVTVMNPGSVQSYVGGFAGNVSGKASIDLCAAFGDVTGLEYTSEVGGFVGKHSTSSTISNSYARGNVVGYALVGGFAGYSYYADIKNSYATGNVSGRSAVGGFVGYFYQAKYQDGAISHSFATGNLRSSSPPDSDNDSPSDFGGFAGMTSYGSISYCYAAASPSKSVSGDDIGGFIGENRNTLLDSNIFRGNTSDELVNNNIFVPDNELFSSWNIDENGARQNAGVWNISCGKLPQIVSMGSEYERITASSETVSCPVCDTGTSELVNYVCQPKVGNINLTDGTTTNDVVTSTTHGDTTVYTLNTDVGSCKQNDILIYTEEDLRNIGVNDYYPNTGSYCLARDITLVEENTNPISTFAGSFNGNGKTITNMYITQSNSKGNGFISNTKGKVTIKNLILDGVSITNGGYAGALVGYSGGDLDVDNVIIKNANIVGDSAGSIVGNTVSTATINISNVTIENLTITNNLQWAKSGSIIGNSSNNATISNVDIDNVTLSATLALASQSSATSSFGGIIGAAVNVTLKDNININGLNINIDANNSSVGFIIGTFKNKAEGRNNAVISIINSVINNPVSSLYSKIQTDCKTLSSTYNSFYSFNYTCSSSKVPDNYTSNCNIVTPACNNIKTNCDMDRQCATIKSLCDDIISKCSITTCSNSETLTDTKNIKTDIGKIVDNSYGECSILQYSNVHTNILEGATSYDSYYTNKIILQNNSINGVACTDINLCHLLGESVDSTYPEYYSEATIIWK